MLVTIGECTSFTVLLAMVVILYYHLYLAALRMERIPAIF